MRQHTRMSVTTVGTVGTMTDQIFVVPDSRSIAQRRNSTTSKQQHTTSI